MSTKRKLQQFSGTGGKDKIIKMNSNKKTNFFRKGQVKRFTEPGQRGFLATTNFREKECVRECYNILNQYADELYGPDDFTKKNDALHPKKDVTAGNGDGVAPGDKTTLKDVSSSDDENDDEEDIATKLENDIKASVVAGKSKDRRFQQVETGISNCVFIRTTLSEPVELAARIVKDLSASSHKAITRNVLRFLPVEIVCKANVTDIVNAAGPLFDKHFLNAPSTTFSVVYNKRCNETVKRDEIINELAQLVTLKNMTHKVDLKNAHFSIIVEVIKGLCCLSVVPEYTQLKKYNLTELGTPPPKTAEPEAVPEVLNLADLTPDGTPSPKPAETKDGYLEVSNVSVPIPVVTE